MQTNFTQLYSQLDLSPDCSLEELKRAYRRRIAELHPDRQGADLRSADAPEELRDLIAMYVAAKRFHRRHGRLPGSSTPHAPPAATGLVPLRPLAREASTPPPRRAELFAILASLVLLLLALDTRDDVSGNAADSAESATTDMSPASVPTILHEPFEEPLPAVLEIGMRPAMVRAIQGEPMHVDDLQWEYGPSWLRFEHNRLVDWYSSPMHPLRTATASPPAEGDAP